MRKAKGRSVLIFGGAGFIGSNLAQWFLTRTRSRVHIFDNLGRHGSHCNLDWLKQFADGPGQLEITVGDIRDPVLVAKAVEQAGEIYHLAAQVAVTTSVRDPRLDFEVNLAGTFNILDAARKSGHKPFILFTSTNKVYGDLDLGTPVRTNSRFFYPGHAGVSESQPLDFHSPYGCSKGAADQYVRDFGRIYGLPVVVFRMSCIAGPRQFGTEDQGWVAHFLYSALEGRPVRIYGDGRQVRDILCVKDLIAAMIAAKRKHSATAGQIYNVGGGSKNTASLLELIDIIQRLTGCKLAYRTEQRRPGDQLVYVSDSSKLTAHTGWTPQIPVEQTVRMLVQFWRENRGEALSRMAGFVARSASVAQTLEQQAA